MTSRIMMQVANRQRPLAFDAAGTAAPLLESAGTPWAGPPLEVHRLVAVESHAESGPRDGEHGLLVILGGKADIVVNQNGHEVTHTAVPGVATLMSGDDRRRVVRITGEAEAAALHLPPDWLARLDAVVPIAGRSRRVDADPTMLSLTQAICEEVRRGAGTGRLYGESLSLAVLSYFSSLLGAKAGDFSSRLSPGERNKLRDHIRERLHEDLSLAELASVVGLGARHFSTVFREAFGTSPHRYVLGERLAEGARLLSTTRLDISEIALRVGFSSQSHFTVAFRRAFGTTPRRYAAVKRSLS